MSIFQKISKLTWTFLMLLSLAVFSYTTFPQVLYQFHRHFLGEYIAGLSLSKPLIFFMFLFGASLIRDLIPKKAFSLKQWIYYQGIIVICLLLVSWLGFVVFTHNKEASHAVFDGSTNNSASEGVWYASYEAKSMFFYSISKPEHYHENKAYLYPILNRIGIEGDIGESEYPFYPKNLMILGFALIALVAIAFMQGLRMINTPNKKLNALLFIYYAFIFSRIVHVAFDGGLFVEFTSHDLAAFFSCTMLFIYVNYPSKKAISFLPLAALIGAPIAGRLIQMGLGHIYGVRLMPNPMMLMIFLSETVLIFSLATLFMHAISLKKMWRDFLTNRAVAMAVLFFCFVAYVYALQIAAFDMRTAMDSAEYYFGKSPKMTNLVVTTADIRNPCNTRPALTYDINGWIIRVYNLTKTLHCENEEKYYAYPSGPYQNRNAKLMIDCATAKGPYSRIGDKCFMNLNNQYSFFQFQVAPDLKGQHVYWTLNYPS
jgi:hypothetical protein